MSRRHFLLLPLFAIAACDSSSPTAPTPTPQPANIVFADSPALSLHRAAITTVIQDTVRQAEGALSVGFLQFIILDENDPRRLIPGWGMGGFTLSSTDIEIVVDAGNPALGQLLPARLPQIVAHEIHHTVRWRSPGPPMTLLEALIFEGMADHFAIELLGVPPAPWSDAFSEAETATYLERARPELDSATFDFSAWFFGFGSDLPVWTGYTLGFRLVRDYLERNPGSTAAGLVHAPAEVFRP